MVNIADILAGFFQWVITSVKYDPANPLFFTSGFFLFFLLLLFLVMVPFGRTPKTRAFVILLFSSWFYYKCSGVFVLLLFGSGIFNYLLGIALGKTEIRGRRALLLVAGISGNLAVLLLFKYTPWFGMVSELFAAGRWSPMALVLPAGLSFYTFANLSYLIDVKKKVIRHEQSLPMYLTYITFFPIVQMGPIERAGSFLPQLSKPFSLSREDVSEGFYLIMSGAIKKMVIGDYVNLHLVSQVFSMPDRYTGMENLAAMLGYSLVIYCDFSGYTDMARGIARWMGFNIHVNFNFPYRAESIGEFWRRWHISLSNWLRDYIFLPVAFRLSRILKKDYLVRETYIRSDLFIFGAASLITFTICGLWHGVGWNFLIWGILHGLALAIQRTWSYVTRQMKKGRSPLSVKINRVAGIMLTFSFVTVAWVFFRMHTPEESFMVFSQITGNFYPQGFPAFMIAYYPVLLMMGAGYALHFSPDIIQIKLREYIVPLGWPWKAVIAMAMLSLILYFRNSGAAMPIYIQF
jgi:D-alanyl-lipoteichoic acid acyltransferase DltB (MBOAT superfamily)